jgi:hypothetical protein
MSTFNKSTCKDTVDDKINDLTKKHIIEAFENKSVGFKVFTKDEKKDFCDELSNLNKEQINPLTLGLKLLGASNISQDYNRKPVESVFNFITQLINTMINQSNISSFSPSWIQQTILIPTGSIYFLNININSEKIEELLKNGTEAIQKHFKKE